MTTTQKINLLNALISERILSEGVFYDTLEKCGDLKFNYYDYMSTHPTNCDLELTRLPDADYDTCCALLTMLLREDHFSNGSFEKRQRAGQVKPIVDRMISLLQNEKQTGGKAVKKILLDDLLHIPADQAANVKVRFNQHNSAEDPMELYLRDPEVVNTRWLFWRTKQRYFNVGQIALCLLKLSADTWLLTTIKYVTKELGVSNGINYEGEELEEYRQYYGRVIIKYHKTAQTQGMFYSTVQDELEVLQLLPTTFDGDEFPGYDNVRLSYIQLASILERRKQSWVAALENQKAVYLITDRFNGKLYVGSATSDKGMLLQRWSNYAENGHGGNKELIALVNEKGFDYVKQYFQYSILENYNAKTDDHVVLKREAWWKDTLLSRQFGYNAN
jgi:hypothetical protein